MAAEPRLRLILSIRRRWLFMGNRCASPQGRSAKPLPNLVGHRILVGLLLALLLVEEQPLPEARLVEAAHAHADKAHREMARWQSVAEQVVGCLP